MHNAIRSESLAHPMKMSICTMLGHKRFGPLKRFAEILDFRVYHLTHKQSMACEDQHTY